MKAAQWNWWDRWFGAPSTFVEKDNGLYPSHIRLPSSFLSTPIGIILGINLVEFFHRGFEVVLGEKFLTTVLFLALFCGLFALIWLINERGEFGPLGRPFVRVEQDALMLVPVNHYYGRQIRMALPTLRALHIGAMAIGWRHKVVQGLRFEWMDGQVKTVRIYYRPVIQAAVIDFLRRKLPASIHFTAADPAPLAGHAGSVRHAY